MHPKGEKGESAARRFLTQKGYRWLASNFLTQWGEIDLVMEDGNTLVFVEVKSRKNNLRGLPEEAITENKKRHIERVALTYLQKTNNFERHIRFDVVTIDSAGLRHYPDAFMASNRYY